MRDWGWLEVGFRVLFAQYSLEFRSFVTGKSIAGFLKKNPTGWTWNPAAEGVPPQSSLGH